MTIIVLKCLAQKYVIKTFLVPNLGIFLISLILELDIINGADFKYDNIIFKFQPKNTQIKHFWFQIKAYLVPNSGIFVFFRQILQLEKFEGADIKYDNGFFFKF